MNYAKVYGIIFRYALGKHIVCAPLIRWMGDYFMKRPSLSFFSTDIFFPCLLIGYIAGFFLPLLFKDLPLYSGIPKTGSVFMEGGGLSGFIRITCIQVLYPAAIFFLGFIPCASPISAGVLFVRSALASYSSLALAVSGASDFLYLTHTLCSIMLLILCYALSKHSLSFSKRRGSAKGAIVYTLSFLFISGVLITVIFVRCVALAFA